MIGAAKRVAREQRLESHRAASIRAAYDASRATVPIMRGQFNDREQSQ